MVKMHSLLLILCACHALAMASSGDEASEDRVDIFAVPETTKDSDDGVLHGKAPRLFEGDIVLDPNQRNIVEAAIKTGKSLEQASSNLYGASSTAYRRWPNGVIYYTIDRSLAYDNRATSAIYAGMKEWSQKTCIRFKRRTNERNYLEFFRGSGCWGHIGMGNGRVQISVGSGCEYRHVMTHEIGHVVGFWHEQSRTDRDSYIRIQWANVPRNLYEAFAKYGSDKINSLGVPYDYGSIMHYPWNAFSTNGRDTVVPIRRVDRQPYQMLSDKDALQANLMYGCTKGPNTPQPPPVTPPPPSPPVPHTPGPSDRPITQCKLVEETTTSGGGQQKPCLANAAQCKAWANRGECQKNPSYMNQYCACACSGDCYDNNPRCPYWAGRGECRNNPAYMLKSCRKSCKVCGTRKVKKCFTVAPPPTKPPSPPPPPPSPPVPTPPIPTPPIPTDIVPSPPVPPKPTTDEKPTPPPPSPPPGTKTIPNPPLPTDCTSPVVAGMSNSQIPDNKITASSSYNRWHGPAQARLHLKAGERNGVGAWCAKTQDTNQFLQIDLGEVNVVKRLATQGRPSIFDKHVSKYHVSFSDDGKAWSQYVTPDNAWRTKEFAGNLDQNSVVTNSFFPPIVARYVRIHPLEWKGMICLRTELYICEKDDGSGAGSGSPALDSFDDLLVRSLKK